MCKNTEEFVKNALQTENLVILEGKYVVLKLNETAVSSWLPVPELVNDD